MNNHTEYKQQEIPYLIDFVKQLHWGIPFLHHQRDKIYNNTNIESDNSNRNYEAWGVNQRHVLIIEIVQVFIYLFHLLFLCAE